MTEDTFLLDYIFKEAEFYKSEENGSKINCNTFQIRKNDLLNKFVNYCNGFDFGLIIERQSGYGFSDALLNMTKNKAVYKAMTYVTSQNILQQVSFLKDCYAV